MKILRVFSRKTSATPEDEDVRIDCLPTLFDQADKIHVSVTFSWDIPKAEFLAKQWERVAPVEIGGVPFEKELKEFEPGMYLKQGYTITSRGCPNKCWFCNAWKNGFKELEIKPGNIVNDDNLLACSDEHVKNVFNMLKSKHSIQLMGLEAKRLKDWHIQEFTKLKINQLFFAYDTPDDYEPLVEASKKLLEAGFKRNKLRCYVLIGYHGDTFEKAKFRLKQVWDLGFLPFAMLYTLDGKFDKDWRRFQKCFTRPALTKALLR